MSKYRNTLPQLSDKLFLADGGIETTLIFHDGLELPDFAAFHLLRTPEGEAALKKYFATYAEIAKRFNTGLILESATWRASADWGKRLGYSAQEMAEANRKAIELMETVREQFASNTAPIIISGCVGPRGDGYVPTQAMSEEEAERYHSEQISVFASSAADMVSAITMNYVEEAVGITRAAQTVKMPVVISFTVETNGDLPTGQSLRSAIEQVDEATSSYPAYYMINCAHPSHFDGKLRDNGSWLERVRGVRANASAKSHAELNESTTLDIGDPKQLGAQYAALRNSLTKLNIMGGCCGTDHRHIEEIAKACL